MLLYILAADVCFFCLYYVTHPLYILKAFLKKKCHFIPHLYHVFYTLLSMSSRLFRTYNYSFSARESIYNMQCSIVKVKDVQQH